MRCSLNRCSRPGYIRIKFVDMGTHVYCYRHAYKPSEKHAEYLEKAKKRWWDRLVWQKERIEWSEKLP